MKSMSEIQNPATAPAVQQQGDAGRLGEAAKRLAETMALGRIPLVVIGSGMSAGVFAPTMSEIHTWLATEIQTEADNCGAKDSLSCPNDPGALGAARSSQACTRLVGRHCTRVTAFSPGPALRFASNE